MKRMKKLLYPLLSVLLVFVLASGVMAEPLSLGQDYTDVITVFYNDSDASDGWYVYSYRYPHALVPENESESNLSAASVNRYYEKKIQEFTVDYIPNQADYFASQHQDVSVEVTYDITCNNNDYFSVLIHKVEEVDGETEETWEGNTFARSSAMIGSLTSLPKLLGILDAGESDEWVEDRQTNKIWEIVCKLVWNMIRENPDGLDYDPCLTEDDIRLIITPEYSLDHDFYINENGDVVFFILSREILTEEAAEETGIVTFRITLEELDDEM